MDTVKVRLQALSQSSQSGAVQFRGPLDCVIKTVKNEGFFAFYQVSFLFCFLWSQSLPSLLSDLSDLSPEFLSALLASSEPRARALCHLLRPRSNFSLFLILSPSLHPSIGTPRATVRCSFGICCSICSLPEGRWVDHWRERTRRVESQTIIPLWIVCGNGHRLCSHPRWTDKVSTAGAAKRDGSVSWTTGLHPADCAGWWYFGALSWVWEYSLERSSGQRCVVLCLWSRFPLGERCWLFLQGTWICSDVCRCLCWLCLLAATLSDRYHQIRTSDTEKKFLLFVCGTKHFTPIWHQRSLSRCFSYNDPCDAGKCDHFFCIWEGFEAVTKRIVFFHRRLKRFLLFPRKLSRNSQNKKRKYFVVISFAFSSPPSFLPLPSSFSSLPPSSFLFSLLPSPFLLSLVPFKVQDVQR